MARVREVSPDTLYFKGTATEAFASLAATSTNLDLLNAAHELQCGPRCEKDISCEFLHYNRPSEPVADMESGMEVYNSKTRGIFTFMGEASQYVTVSQQHEINLWPLLESVLGLVDQAREVSETLHFDYTDWTQKKDASIETTIISSCRDSLQWLACWQGKRYDACSLTLQYTALATVSDDICIPPLDLVHGKFRMFQISAYEITQRMQTEGWGRDATRVLLSLVLQYILQYAEKVEAYQQDDPRVRIHAILGRSPTVWDSTVYRARTADVYGVVICIARMDDTGPLPDSWFFEAGINDCIAMDMGKMTARIYERDIHKPTETTLPSGTNGKQQETGTSRRAKYQSLYVDILDRLLRNGAPAILTRFGSAGFLFSYMVDRYRERAAGERIPVSPMVEKHVAQLWGHKAPDPWTEGLFRLRVLASTAIIPDCNANNTSHGVSLPPEVLHSCRDRQQERRDLFKQVTSSAAHGLAPTPPTQTQDILVGTKLAQCLHSLSFQARSPSHLRQLLSSVEELRYTSLSSKVSNEDMWALCVGCQTGCSQKCEWLAFAEYLAQQAK